MEHIISRKVNLVVRVFNDYDLKPITGGISMFLNKCLVKTVRKDGGYFIFTNLEEDNYELEIKAEDYFNEVLHVNLNELNNLNPIVNVRLKLKPSFFYYNDATIVKFTLYDEKTKLPIVNKDIKAILSTKGYFVGQIINELIEASSCESKLEEFYEEFFSGDSLYIEASSKKNCEIVTVFEKTKDNNYKFNNVLKSNHHQGEKLRKAFITKSDCNGNVVIYFRNLLREKNNLKIMVGLDSNIKGVNIDIEKGVVTDLGKILI